MENEKKSRGFDRRKPGTNRRDLEGHEVSLDADQRAERGDRRNYVPGRRRTGADSSEKDSREGIEARCFSAFQRHLLATSSATPENSLRIVQDFSIYLNNLSKQLLEASERDFENFLHLINNRHLSEVVVKKYATVLLDFYLLLIQEGVIVNNPLIFLCKVLATDHTLSEFAPKEVDKFAQALAEAEPKPAPPPLPSFDTREMPSRMAIRASNKDKRRPHFQERFSLKAWHYAVLVVVLIGVFVFIRYFPMEQVSAVVAGLHPAPSLSQGGAAGVSGEDVPRVGLPPGPEKSIIHSISRNRPFDRVNYFYQNNLADYYCKKFLQTFCHQQSLLLNPLNRDIQVLEEGRLIYSRHCVRCHDAKGRGNGPDVAYLAAPPKRLDFVGDRVLEKDAFLFWTIAEGGEPFSSGMPAFKDTLTEKEIWAVIIRLGFL